MGNSNVAEHEFSTCVTGREGEEKGRGEKLGETLVFFFSLSLLLLYAASPAKMGVSTCAAFVSSH